MIRRSIVIIAVTTVCVMMLGYAGMRSYATHRCTRYAPGFSEEKWKRITNGMPESSVCDLIGEPLSRGNYGQIWIYSYNKSAPFYRGCRLVMSNKVVSEKLDYFDWF